MDAVAVTVAKASPNQVLATFASKSQKGVVRTVKLVHAAGGDYIGCDCPAWIFQRGARADRRCKHTEAARSLGVKAA